MIFIPEAFLTGLNKRFLERKLKVPDSRNLIEQMRNALSKLMQNKNRRDKLVKSGSNSSGSGKDSVVLTDSSNSDDDEIDVNSETKQVVKKPEKLTIFLPSNSSDSDGCKLTVANSPTRSLLNRNIPPVSDSVFQDVNVDGEDFFNSCIPFPNSVRAFDEILASSPSLSGTLTATQVSLRTIASSSPTEQSKKTADSSDTEIGSESSRESGRRTKSGAPKKRAIVQTESHDEQFDLGEHSDIILPAS